MNCTYDYLTFENPEAITLSRGGQTIPTAYRIAVGTKEQVPSHGVALTQNPDWLVPQILLTESPQIGDIITDGSGFQWVILRQQAPICLGCWICNCVRLALSDLADTIQIYASTETNGVGGDRLLTQGTKLFDGQARIQPTTAQVMELWGTVDMWRDNNTWMISFFACYPKHVREANKQSEFYWRYPVNDFYAGIACCYHQDLIDEYMVEFKKDPYTEYQDDLTIKHLIRDNKKKIYNTWHDYAQHTGVGERAFGTNPKEESSNYISENFIGE